ncbi:hypothetical protein F7725_013100 [Dissostichus mawsoni]|uniref:Uncharacterized protein n=1 Tax=Dissostichus mawsoni TaxID=36200 RepID=A0A7J5YSV5_DISMA|nr:hypothetical protein F7725_013100 [Dissostichus mawsoni]
MEVASVQSKQLVSFSATIHDTVLWDPSTCPRPSDSLTPGHQQSWSEVVRRSLLNGETSPPRLRLQNRFTTQSDDPVHPADSPAALTCPDDPVHPADAPAALTSPDLHPADTATPCAGSRQYLCCFPGHCEFNSASLIPSWRPPHVDWLTMLHLQCQ